jgi:DNA-binding transcriptional LysR family regulator
VELRQLEAFVSVATLRSFRAAANRLNVTQPAISIRISTLEEELGVRLFERAGTKVRPTAKGLELLTYAEQVLDRAHTLKGVAHSSDSLQKVRLGTTSTIVHAWLTSLMSSLRREFPHLTLELNIDTSPRLRGLLVSGALDVAILMGPVHEAGLRNLAVRTYRTAWIVSPTANLSPDVLTLPEIARHPVITHGRDSATYGSLEELFRLNGLWPVQLSSSNSAEAILSIARSGLAIGALSEACVRPADPTLRLLRCEVELPRYEFFAAYHLDSVGRIGMIVAELAKQVASEHGIGD